MKRNETITEETVKFIDENQDKDLCDRLAKAFLEATTDENGKGDTAKVLCALAEVTASFLKMCGRHAKDGELKAEDYFDPYTDILDFYCFLYDHPEKEESENSEQE